ncbi:MAG: ABC transporter permease [Caldilineaceae bacterium]|nr:ABC transporter permease [Caldilineaceae bacterium]
MTTSSPQTLTQPAVVADVKERTYVASQWKLMWKRFVRHRLAIVGGVLIILFYIAALFADFFAYAPPESSSAQRSLIPPQPIHWFDQGRWNPYVYPLARRRDPATFQLVYTPDTTRKIRLTFFGQGFSYRLFGLIPTDRHLLGVQGGAEAVDTLFLLGTDMQGRDMWSRLIYATRVSLTIGLAGVAISLLLGLIFGGISGLRGGVADEIIQRVIEVLRSIPTIPLWMGLAAALPRTWNIIQVYFAITIIISLISWTELARVARGRFLALREEDFITSARLDGCSHRQIIFGHMVPSFLSHIIAATTLALPVMIISETALSFLGLGLRPPAISWGVMLQQAQNVQAIALTPWLLYPAIPVVVAVLAFNFLGDGLRDAADPYSR